MNDRREKAMVDVFCTHYQHPHLGLDEEFDTSVRRAPQRKELCLVLVGLKVWGP